MWRIGKKRSLFSPSSAPTGHRNTECADSQTRTPWAHLHAHPAQNNRRRVSVIFRAGCPKWNAQGAHIGMDATTGNTAARFAERTPVEHCHTKKSGDSKLESPPFVITYSLLLFCNGARHRTPLLLSETQVPHCTEFLRMLFCRESIFIHLKIDTLLTIAATDTIATAIIVIVSIKQSPFFF